MSFVTLQGKERIYNIPYFPSDAELALRISVPLNNTLRSVKEVHTLKEKTRKISEATCKQFQNTTAIVHKHWRNIKEKSKGD